MVPLFLLATAGLGSALTQDVEVIIATPGRPYHMGDTVALTVYVFHDGALADPDQIVVGVSQYSGPPRLLAAIRTSQGTYSSTFQIQVDDLLGSSSTPGYLSIGPFANATFGSVTDEAYRALDVLSPSPPSMEVRLFVSDAQVEPGALLGIGVQVLQDGSLHNASILNLTVTYSGGPTPTPLVPATHTGPGVYNATYAVPSDIGLSTPLWITATANLGPDSATNNTNVIVRPRTPFVLWYSFLSANFTQQRFAVHVADPSGWPVVAAEVSVSYEQACYPGCSFQGWANGSTDASGSVSLTLMHDAHPFDPSHDYLNFRGTVAKGASRQSFSGITLVPRPIGSWRSYLDGAPRTYPPGQTVFINFTAASGIPLLTPANYYASTLDRVLAAGRTFLDQNGRVGFHFVMPPEPVWLEVSMNLSGYWDQARATVLPTNTLDIQVGPIAVGGVTSIRVTRPAGSTANRVQFAFLPYNAAQADELSNASWYPLGGVGLYWDERSLARANASFELVLPRFLPKDASYILVVQTGGLMFGRYGWTDPVFTQVVDVHNQMPTALAAFSSVDVVPGETVRADTSGSLDPDGLIAGVTVDWGDGSTSANRTWNPVAEHTYGSPGLYAVTVRVVDDSGAVNATSYAIRVESTVLGIRSSTFWLGTGVAAVAAVAAAIILCQRRRREPPSDDPTVNAATPPRNRP